MANERKQVQFDQSDQNDETLLVTFNQGASDETAKQRKRSRAVSRVSMGSDTDDDVEKEGVDVSLVSLKFPRGMFPTEMFPRGMFPRVMFPRGYSQGKFPYKSDGDAKVP